MTAATIYLVFAGLFLFISLMGGKTQLSHDQIATLETFFSQTNLLIAFGVFGVCKRLDTIIERGKEK